MPLNGPDERILTDAIRDILKATANCSKEDLHYLWRRDILPPLIYQWILKQRKEKPE